MLFWLMLFFCETTVIHDEDGNIIVHSLIKKGINEPQWFGVLRHLMYGIWNY